MRLKVQTLLTTETDDPADDAVGDRLATLVCDALERGAPPAAVVVRADRIELIPLGPIVREDTSVQRFMAALSRSQVDDEQDGEPLAVGLIGTFALRRGEVDRPIPVAMVFLEWTDCRWWQWRSLLEPDSTTVREGTQTVRRATDGDSRPDRLGGWWSLGRRLGVRLRMRRVEEPPEPVVVH